ncbi:AsmA family protein [Algoriphagus sp. CAU 1675]|uniref:AsmA family protein n=1 Tax=Algoriphagus sp. CAU 1675 TaxID=3032597 RepID=UPI0023DB4221|nr:AsmA family protein [Algoriphagus sp. CAU 1675]MDF2156417.1 AsmA-like C-terminal region-containing protein [Algoriphagus sp. CAU 1675]
MKKSILIVAGIFIFLIAGALAVPLLFKDKIIARVNKELNKNLDATIYFDSDNISLSVFKNFPSISAGIGDFGIVGKREFATDTLVHLDELGIDFDLWSVIFDEYPTLTGLHLDGGTVYVKVLEDGKANYDITIPSEEQSSEESGFRLGIEEIDVSGINLIYDDRALQFFMALKDIQGSGSGDFTADVYDLPLKAQAQIVDLVYEGVSYLSDKSFVGETLLNVDMDKMKFSLKDGSFGLNDFLFNMSGYIALPEHGVDYDLAFNGQNTDFKSLLSLVPGIYSESFSDLETSGSMDFQGFLKGLYTEETFPAFDISLRVKDGYFKYPDLPRPVSKINLDLGLKNDSDQLENTSVSIPVFNLVFGSNPVSGNFLLKNLRSYEMAGELLGKLDLEELTSIFPIEGMDLKGTMDMDIKANGRYDSIAEIIPTINAKVNLQNGYAKSKDYPAPLEAMHVLASIQNKSGKMDDFSVDLSSFGFMLEGESIHGNLKLNDFKSMNWDGAIEGTVDLAKIMAIFPIEGTQLEGRITADISSSGSYSAIEKKQYNQIKTSGDLEIANLIYQSEDLPQGVQIQAAEADFNPQRINLKKFDSKIGNSPIQATGYLSQYMDYLLSENGVLKGELSLFSKKFDANEWISETEESTSTEPSVIQLPENIDFKMAVNADEVLYDKLNLKEVKGSLSLKDGVLRFEDAGMKTLDGRIALNGAYDPREISSPKFDFNLDVSEISIPAAFQAIESVKVFAPIAKDLTGKINTNIDFSGILGQDMMPIISSLDVSGILKVAEAALKSSKIVEQINLVTKINELHSLQLKNVAIPIKIEHGMMEVKPFTVKLWDYQTTIQGSAGFDGSINYLLNMQVPAGKFGAQANSILASISGTEATASTLIPVSLNLTGSYTQPKISLAGGNSMESLLTNALKARVQGEKEAIKEQATAEFKAREDSIKQEIRNKAEIVQDSVKKELEKKTGEATDKVVEEAKNLLKGFIKKKTTKPDSTKTKPDSTTVSN